MIIENKEIGVRFGVKGNEDFEKWLAEHDKQTREDVIEEVLSIINAIINGIHQEFKKNGDMVNLGVICELQRFRDKLKEQNK